MGRNASAWWDEKSQSWRSQSIGPTSDKSGRRTGVRNYEIGPPTGRDGRANHAAAQLWVQAELAKEAESVRYEGEPTFGALADQYLDWCRKEGLAERTIRGYGERLRVFASYEHDGHLYRDKLARHFRPADMWRVTKRLKELGFAPTWARDVSGAAKACFAWAARPVDDRVPERILSSNPFEGIETIRVPAPPKRYAGPLARSEFFEFALCRVIDSSWDGVRLRAKCDWRWDRLAIAYWRFCEATGARPDEAARLEWSHIDWDAAVAILRGKTTDATGKMRRVPLPPSVIRILRAIQQLPEHHEQYVFTHEARSKEGGYARQGLAGVPWKGNAMAHKFKSWRDSAIEAGLAIEASGPNVLTLYQLRRDMGADVLRATGSYAESANVLDHSVAVNEKYYASFGHSRATDAVSKVDEIRRRKGD